MNRLDCHWSQTQKPKGATRALRGTIFFFSRPTSIGEDCLFIYKTQNESCGTHFSLEASDHQRPHLTRAAVTVALIAEQFQLIPAVANYLKNRKWPEEKVAGR